MDIYIGNKKRQINMVAVGIVTAGLIVVLILTGVLVNLLRENPYGKEVVIDNFGTYYEDAPQDIKDRMFSSLYDVVALNVDDGAMISANGATIRDGSAVNNYSSEQDLHVGKYIVDVPEMKMSFQGYFEWSNSNNNMYLSGYQAIYTCLPVNDLIYGDFDCEDMFADDAVTKFPIVAALPVTIERYSNNYSEYTKYTIRYELSDDGEKLSLIFLDYTGGNYNNAIATVRELGFDANDYNIVYKDETMQNAWPYVGE